jgi:hypothetical protein
MDDKAKKHKDTLSVLQSYLQETPSEIIKKEMAEISQMNFVGTSAHDYFLNFHKNYGGHKNRQPKIKVPSLSTKITA